MALDWPTYKSFRLLIGLARTRVRFWIPPQGKIGLIMVCWWGVGDQFDRPRVTVQNFSYLACLEVAEKFVVVVVVG